MSFRIQPDLLFGFEDVAVEGIAGAVSGDIAEDLQVLRVMRYVENPARGKTIGKFSKLSNSKCTTLKKIYIYIYK